jgi:hypothetical protein
MTGFRRSGLPHAVYDLAGYLGGTYVIGPIRQRLLDVLYFFPSRLIRRFRVRGDHLVISLLGVERLAYLAKATPSARGDD